MPPTIIHYVVRKCPICFRTEHMFNRMQIEGLVDVIEVDVESTVSGDLIDRYNYFCRKVLGGSREVPVILLGESKWFIPKRRSRVGNVEKPDMVGEAVVDLEKELRKNIEGHREKSFPPTHGDMIFGAVGR